MDNNCPTCGEEYGSEKIIEELEAERDKLLEEGSTLAAGQCCVDGMLRGDDRGYQYCELQKENKRLRDSAKFFYSVVKTVYDYQHIRQPDVDLINARIQTESKVDRAILDIDFKKHREVLGEKQ